MRFLFEKRYADLVTPDGAVYVAYASDLQWGPLRHAFAGATVYRPDGTREGVRATTVPSDLDSRPGPAVRQIRFACKTGEFRLRYEPGVDPWRPRVSIPPDGLSWWVERPRAVGSVVWPGDAKVATGLGYVDRVRLRRSLRRIGLRRLDWGRAHLADATVVYLRLHLARGHDWVSVVRWRTGGAGPEETWPEVGDEAALPPGLEITPHRLLHRGPASELLPEAGLSERVFLRLLGGRLRDERWLSCPGETNGHGSTGWVVHETVQR